MRCPLCNAPTEIKDTRSKRNESVLRRRVCFNMHHFKTEEKPISEPKPKRPQDKD